MAFEREEPAANMRVMANQLREMYVALLQANFTQAEALAVIGEVIKAGMQNNQGD